MLLRILSRLAVATVFFAAWFLVAGRVAWATGMGLSYRVSNVRLRADVAARPHGSRLAS